MKRRAFTIIEVLTVIMIFSILLGISGYAYSIALKRTRDQQRITDLSNIKSGLELYYLDNKSFPQFFSDGNGEIANAAFQLAPGYFVNCNNSNKGIWPTYIQNFPNDPLSKRSTTDDCTTINNNQSGEYLYFANKKTTGKTGYLLAALVERSNNINMIGNEATALSGEGGWGYASIEAIFCNQLADNCTHNYKLTSSKND